MVIGSSLGIRNMAGSYYRAFWPQYIRAALVCAFVGILTGVIIIVLASALMIAPKGANANPEVPIA